MHHYAHPIPEVRTLLDLVLLFESNALTWNIRDIHASFDSNEDVWVGLYWPQDGAPYFDVAYRERIRPEKRLVEFFAKRPTCEVLDWSPGRLLCIRTHGADAVQFSELVLEVVEALHGPVGNAFRASFEECKAAG